MLTKWTAVKPVAKEKHFLVSKVVEPELDGEKVEWIDLEAVHSKVTRRIQWQELRDETQWLRGCQPSASAKRLCMALQGL